MKWARFLMSDKASVCLSGSASMMVICVTGCWSIWVCAWRSPFTTLSIDLSKNDVQRTDDRGDVGEQMAAAEQVHRLQMRERGCADFAPVGLVRSIRDQVHDEFALGGFHGHIDLASGHAKALRVKLEMMDQGFHRALHLAAARGKNLVVLHRDRTLPIRTTEFGDTLSHDAHRLTHFLHAD